MGHTGRPSPPSGSCRAGTAPRARACSELLGRLASSGAVAPHGRPPGILRGGRSRRRDHQRHLWAAASGTEWTLDLMAGCDLLLVIQNRDRVSEETIPSKTYEYLASGRAVLALVHRNPELAGLVRAAGNTAVEGDDVEAVAHALEDCYDRWLSNALGGRSCEKYSPARAAGQLIAWSRSLRRGATGLAGSTRAKKAGPDE